MHNLYFSFGGKSSADCGLRQLQPLRYSGATPVYDEVKVPGRSGSVLFPDGSFNDVTASCECCLMNESDVSGTFALVNEFLLGTQGYQRLEDPLEPAYYRLACATVGAEYYRQAPNYAPFTLEFRCKPQKYLKSGENAVTITSSGTTLVNPTAFASKPLITVYGGGEGTLTVGGTTVEFKSGYSTPCVLDCENEDTYTGAKNQNDYVTVGEYPTIPAGISTVSWTGGIASVAITPRWWTL